MSFTAEYTYRARWSIYKTMMNLKKMEMVTGMASKRGRIDVWFKLLVCVLGIALAAGSAYAVNSLMRYEDIPKMTAAGVSQEVINYFTANQTTSIMSGDIVQMKKSGLTNQQILSAIKADLYKPEIKPTVMEEAELVAQLKASGMSDEGIQQFIDELKTDTSRHVDANGNVVRKYQTERKRPDYATTGAVFPERDDYYYDPYRSNFRINVRVPVGP